MFKEIPYNNAINLVLISLEFHLWRQIINSEIGHMQSKLGLETEKIYTIQILSIANQSTYVRIAYLNYRLPTSNYELFIVLVWERFKQLSVLAATFFNYFLISKIWHTYYILFIIWTCQTIETACLLKVSYKSWIF